MIEINRNGYVIEVYTIGGRVWAAIGLYCCEATTQEGAVNGVLEMVRGTYHAA